MGDEATGYAVLTVWANAGNSMASVVKANFLNTYGKAAIESLGSISRGVNFSALQSEYQAMIDRGVSRESPAPIDLSSGLVKVGATTENGAAAFLGVIGQTLTSFSDRVIGTSTNVLDAAETGITSTLKLLPILIIVVGLGYLVFQSGLLKDGLKAK